jgi:hypothetical protein
MTLYRTAFIETRETPAKGMFKSKTMTVNGDDLARDVQALVTEMATEGYLLKSSSPVNSSGIHMGSYPYSYTSGILLIFEQKL